MSDSVWVTKTIRELGAGNGPTVQTGPFGSQLHAEDYVEEGVPFILIRNIGEGGLKPDDLPRISFSDAKRLARYSLKLGDIVFTRVGRAGSCLLVTENESGWIISGQTLRLRLDNSKLDNRFLFYALQSHAVQKFVLNSSVGTTRESLNTKILESIPVLHPRHCEQRRIAEILSTLDETIDQTEALITKYQQIKAGLMHDLFTRGVTPDGHLRPTSAQAPHLYKESPLGWIPKEWEVQALGAFATSRPGGFVNGPFGSDLLTSELTDSGVPVIYVQDIKEDEYRRFSNAHVTERKANELLVCNVRTEDVLVAKVGDPPGIAAIYHGLERAVVTQDVIRIRPADDIVPQFLASLLNSSVGTRAIRRIIIEGTRARVSLTEFKRLLLLKPSRKEQELIADRVSIAQRAICALSTYVAKTKIAKHGLMSDLLTGRMRVKVAEPASA